MRARMLWFMKDDTALEGRGRGFFFFLSVKED